MIASQCYYKKEIPPEEQWNLKEYVL